MHSLKVLISMIVLYFKEYMVHRKLYIRGNTPNEKCKYGLKSSQTLNMISIPILKQKPPDISLTHSFQLSLIVMKIYINVTPTNYYSEEIWDTYETNKMDECKHIAFY